MTFATEAAKQASKRFVLARVTPARYVGASLASIGGGVYSMTFPYPMASVQRNGTALTKTTGTPGSNDNWSYDETTQTFLVKLASAPDVSTNVVIAFYYLFYSTGPGTEAYETPTDSATTLRYWQPRLLDSPSVKQSLKNIISGVFTIDDINLKIANADFGFQSYLTDNDSFNDCELALWYCITDTATANATKIYTGKCKRIAVSSEDVTLTAYDAFSRLRQSAFFGDTADESIFQKQSSSFPNMDARKQNEPVRLVIGKHSRWKSKPNNTGTSSVNGSETLDPEFLFEAVCTNVSTTLNTSTNRAWGICRTTSDGIRTPAAWPVPSSFANNGGSPLQLTYTNAVAATIDVVIGDLLNFTDGITAAYGRVIRINVGGANTDIYVQTNLRSSPAYTTGVTITTVPAIALVIRDASGNEYWPRYTLDFTVAAVTTSGGNKYYAVTFVNGFETAGTSPHAYNAGVGTSYDGGATKALTLLDPNVHKIYWRVRPSVTNASHATVLTNLCTAAGLTVNATTFTAADAAFTANVLLSIPYFDQKDYGAYLDYAQTLLGSTLGFLSVNAAGQAEYKLVTGNAAAAVAKTDSDVWDLSADVDYTDIVTQIIAYNPHDFADISTAASSATSSESALSKYLYGIKRTTQLRHVLDRISTRLATHLAVKSKPLIYYRMASATQDLTAALDDDLTLTHGIALGGSGSNNMSVTALDKNLDRVAIEAVDLIGL